MRPNQDILSDSSSITCQGILSSLETQIKLAIIYLHLPSNLTHRSLFICTDNYFNWPFNGLITNDSPEPYLIISLNSLILGFKTPQPSIFFNAIVICLRIRTFLLYRMILKVLPSVALLFCWKFSDHHRWLVQGCFPPCDSSIIYRFGL